MKQSLQDSTDRKKWEGLISAFDELIKVRENAIGKI
jgi:hypothetical protein